MGKISLAKKILFPLLSLFLLYQSWDIISFIDKISPKPILGIEAFLLAFFINLCITGIFAFTGFAYPTHRILPKVYYEIQAPKRIKSMYKLMGVRIFRFLLMLFFWGRKGQREKYFDGKRSGLKNLVYQTKQSEFGHFAAFVVLMLCSIYFTIAEQYHLAFWAFLINFIGNFYPVILQRYHRARIQHLAI